MRERAKRASTSKIMYIFRSHAEMTFLYELYYYCFFFYIVFIMNLLILAERCSVHHRIRNVHFPIGAKETPRKNASEIFRFHVAKSDIISYTLLVHGIREISTFWFHIPWGRRPNGIWNQNVDISRIPWEQAGVQRFYLFKCTHNNLLRSIEIFECWGFIKGLLTAGTVPARMLPGVSPVTLLLPSARPESF